MVDVLTLPTSEQALGVKQYALDGYLNFAVSAPVTKGQTVQISGDGTVAPSSAAGKFMVAVTSQPTIGKEVTVFVGKGKVKVQSSGAIAANAKVTASATAPGKVEALTVSTAADAANVGGIAISAAADGSVEILLE